MGRCASPCLGDLDPNAYRAPARQGAGAVRRPDAAGSGCSAELDEQIAAASADAPLRARRGAAAPPRAAGGRCSSGWTGMLRAVARRPRLVLARHPVKERFDAFWVVERPGGRLGPAAGLRASWRSAPRPRSRRAPAAGHGPAGGGRRGPDRVRLGRRARAAELAARPRPGDRAAARRSWSARAAGRAASAAASLAPRLRSGGHRAAASASSSRATPRGVDRQLLPRRARSPCSWPGASRRASRVLRGDEVDSRRRGGRRRGRRPALLSLVGLRQADRDHLLDHQPPPAHPPGASWPRHVEQTRLDRVQGVSTQQSAIQRLLQVGPSTSTPPRRGMRDFAFRGVAQPEKVMATVDQAQRE